jgi:excisionase family DNA binding protein
MKTVRIPASPGDSEDRLESLQQLIQERLAGGKDFVVTIADEDETLSPEQAAQRLGFSRQHVMRLINAGMLDADVLPGSRYRKIPLSSILAFEEAREAGRRRADDFSASLDELGAPAD